MIWLVFMAWVRVRTFVCYLTPNPFYINNQFYYKQFSMSTQFNSQKHFYFKLFNLFTQLYITIQFSVSIVSMSKTVQFQTVQFSNKLAF